MEHPHPISQMPLPLPIKILYKKTKGCNNILPHPRYIPKFLTLQKFQYFGSNSLCKNILKKKLMIFDKFPLFPLSGRMSIQVPYVPWQPCISY